MEIKNDVFGDVLVPPLEGGRIIEKGPGVLPYYVGKGRLHCIRIGKRGMRLCFRSELEQLRDELEAKNASGRKPKSRSGTTT